MPIAAPSDEPPHDRDPLIGTVIGDVRIVRLIRADRLSRLYEGLELRVGRTVAVRIMRPMISDAGDRGRRDPEKNLLMRFSHPGVVQVYATGLHVMDGMHLPYCVMEFVLRPRTLTDYAKVLGLSVRDRVDLFCRVCDAVAHIHERQVIHGDLKPANILVDASGSPKVTGFHLAAAMDSHDDVTAMETRGHMILGSLQYISPEQLRGDATKIDRRCDVYALGMVLYELLSGRLPYELRRKPISDVIRIVLLEDPSPISAFDKSLHRDLVAIVGKCLERDQDKRYASAEALRDDLARHLAGEPILAAPPTFMSRLRKMATKLLTGSPAP